MNRSADFEGRFGGYREKKGKVIILSAAASGWAGWALAHPEFGSSVYPITTRGTDYAHHITASPSGFENPAASLHMPYVFIFIFLLGKFGTVRS